MTGNILSIKTYYKYLNRTDDVSLFPHIGEEIFINKDEDNRKDKYKISRGSIIKLF